MPVREIKTTLRLDGEKEFNKEIQEATRNMRVMDADLRAISAEFKASGNAQQYFTQRNETLNNQIRQQEQIVEALNRAVRESAEKYGDAARETDGYRIKLSNATAKLFDMRNEAEKANRELEELGRDSGRIGQQIERGIGDAAEDAADKVERMFAGVSEDIEAIKGSFAFQTTMSAGEFVVDAVSGVVDFVNENQELNRQIAIARHNIEQYDLNWDDVQGLIIRAAAITGNQDGAIEAVSNLASAGFDSEEMLKAAMDALLGVFLTTGGSLSFESLAEDFRASVVARAPTGTYAEVIEEVLQGVAVEEVEKALQAAETTEEAIQIALSVLTSGGMQTKTRDFEEQNAELIETQIKQQKLALEWAAVAQELAPIVTDVTDVMIFLVGWLKEMATNASTTVAGIKEIINNPENTVLSAEWNKENLKKYSPEFAGALESGQLDSWAGTWQYVTDQLGEMFANLFPSAGAEEMTGEWEAQGENAVNALELGMLSKAQESTTADDIMKGMVEDMSAENENANTAGVNLMTELANGIADGGTAAVANVQSVVNQINAALASISTAGIAYGAGLGIGGVQLQVDGNDLSTVVSANTGRKVKATMMVK